MSRFRQHQRNWAPPGPRRALITALDELRHLAGSPSSHVIADAIRRELSRHDVSRRTVSRMLAGELRRLRSWGQLEAIVRVLAKRVPDLQVESTTRRFYRLWRALEADVETTPDVAIGVQVGAAPIPVSVYLADGATHAEVEAAIEEALVASGLLVTGREEPVVGSWFRTYRAQAAAAVKGELGATAAHTAETYAILAKDAEVTASLMEHLGPVIEALRPERNAVVRVGALLIVKVDGVLSVQQLTPAQQYRLNHEPSLVQRPNEILKLLALPPDDLIPEHTAALLDSAPRPASAETE